MSYLAKLSVFIVALNLGACVQNQNKNSESEAKRIKWPKEDHVPGVTKPGESVVKLRLNCADEVDGESDSPWLQLLQHDAQNTPKATLLLDYDEWSVFEQQVVQKSKSFSFNEVTMVHGTSHYSEQVAQAGGPFLGYQAHTLAGTKSVSFSLDPIQSGVVPSGFPEKFKAKISYTINGVFSEKKEVVDKEVTCQYYPEPNEK